MTFTELEAKRNESAVREFMEKRRPPPHIRSRLDIGYEFNGQVIDLFAIRPDWQDETTLRQHPFARIRYVKSQGEWRLYWKRADLKWHIYEPSPRHKFLKQALEVIHADAYCCFFG